MATLNSTPIYTCLTDVTVKGNYRVQIKGIWFDIDDDQILRADGGPNPTGQAILWYQRTEFGFNIRCFTPQYES